MKIIMVCDILLVVYFAYIIIKNDSFKNIDNKTQLFTEYNDILLHQQFEICSV